MIVTFVDGDDYGDENFRNNLYSILERHDPWKTLSSIVYFPAIEIFPIKNV